MAITPAFQAGDVGSIPISRFVMFPYFKLTHFFCSLSFWSVKISLFEKFKHIFNGYFVLFKTHIFIF